MNAKTILRLIGWGSLLAGVCVAIYAAANDRRDKTTKMETNEIKRLIEDLDVRYQLAVKNNDATTMDEILGDDFVLVTGRGKVFNKSELLDEARRGTTVYEHQEDDHRTVRVWGDTAVITALLWEKGVSGDKAFDKKLWFSDVYKLTPTGWKYVFAQSSIPIPDEE